MKVTFPTYEIARTGIYARETESGKTDTHVSSYKTAQRAGMPVRDTNEGHTCLSLQDRTKGWYAGERHKNVKMRDRNVSPYKTAQKVGTPVRDTKKCENEKH